MKKCGQSRSQPQTKPKSDAHRKSLAGGIKAPFQHEKLLTDPQEILEFSNDLLVSKFACPGLCINLKSLITTWEHEAITHHHHTCQLSSKLWGLKLSFEPPQKLSPGGFQTHNLDPLVPHLKSGLLALCEPLMRMKTTMATT